MWRLLLAQAPQGVCRGISSTLTIQFKKNFRNLETLGLLQDYLCIENKKNIIRGVSENKKTDIKIHTINIDMPVIINIFRYALWPHTESQ